MYLLALLARIFLLPWVSWGFPPPCSKMHLNTTSWQLISICIINTYLSVFLVKCKFLKARGHACLLVHDQFLFTDCCSVAKSCLTLCDPMDCSSPGSSVHVILQARIPEWVAISFSRRSSLTRDWTCVSCIGRWVLYQRATREAHLHTCMLWNMNRVNCGHSYA